MGGENQSLKSLDNLEGPFGGKVRLVWKSDIRKSGVWGRSPHLKWGSGGQRPPSLADPLLCLDKVRKVRLG